MRFGRVVVTTVVAGGVLAGASLASHVTAVDPATVPTGLLVAHNRVDVIPVSAIQKAVRGGGAEVYVQHVRLAADQATPWHTHPGPAILTIVAGSLTYEHAASGACHRDVYTAGEGFTDRGLGKVHRAIAGPEGADLYVTYIFPSGTPGGPLIPRDPVAQCLD